MGTNFEYLRLETNFRNFWSSLNFWVLLNGKYIIIKSDELRAGTRIIKIRNHALYPDITMSPELLNVDVIWFVLPSYLLFEWFFFINTSINESFVLTGNEEVDIHASFLEGRFFGCIIQLPLQEL